MSPLPRLHHHDIMTIVGLLHSARTKSFCHILTQTKKKLTNITQRIVTNGTYEELISPQ